MIPKNKMFIEMRYNIMLSIIIFLLSLSYIDSTSYEPDDESDEMIALNDAFYTTPDGYIILKRGAVGGAVLKDIFGKKKRNVGGTVLRDLLGKKKRMAVVGGTVLKDLLGK